MSKDEIIKLLSNPKFTITEGGFSTEEFGLKIGYSKSRASELLKKAFAAGLVEFAGRRRFLRRDGNPGLCPVYRYTKETLQAMKTKK